MTIGIDQALRVAYFPKQSCTIFLPNRFVDRLLHLQLEGDGSLTGYVEETIKQQKRVNRKPVKIITPDEGKEKSLDIRVCYQQNSGGTSLVLQGSGRSISFAPTTLTTEVWRSLCIEVLKVA